jgi:hypothetical protein
MLLDYFLRLPFRSCTLIIEVNLFSFPSSTNRLLGLGSNSASKAFFPGTDAVLSRRIDDKTCVLMISQSGDDYGITI